MGMQADARRMSEIDWASWVPTEKATLLFVLRDGQVLLIHKKTGLGAGKINGPGGRIDPGETPRQCAIREVQEELCVTPTGYHAHIMLTTREITEKGFGKKVREWDRVELLEHAREGWAHTVNRHLERRESRPALITDPWRPRAWRP